MVIEAYYERGWRVWVAYYKDAEGFQVGDCVYGNSRADAVATLKLSV